MVKVLMNTADVAAEVKCLRRLIGMRCSNVYDISPKAYLFKLMNSSGVTESGESEKVLLLMESGSRLHTTQYIRDKNVTPSVFTLKLRKHIRTRRLEDVRQLGYDRIILFQFGLGAIAYYVILELYSQGNILLTDSEYTVMTLLRSHRDDDKGLAIMSRHRYPIDACRSFERTSYEKLNMALTFSSVSNGQESVELGEAGSGNKNKNLSNATKKANLKTVLGEALSYGPALTEHVILDAGLLPNTKIGIDSKIDQHSIDTLARAVAKFEDWLAEVILGQSVPEGYILLQAKLIGKKDIPIPQEISVDKIYDEFCPLLLNQFKSRECMKFATFDEALDEFYSKIESQRVEHQQKSKESSALQKLNKIRLDQENRVQTLSKEVDHCVKMAQLIEYNLEDVDAAILAVRVALANGMDWEDLARMVKEERKSGNPVAGIIDKLHLERNCITLLLSNNLDDMDEDEKTSPVDKVEVDLSLSVHANARRWYEMKKKQESKQEKTMTSHAKAFKAAERKTRLQLAQEKTVTAISHIRKVHWFEKFNWFISSENYLVISGRDAQQNDMIVKRYMSKGDLYVHADLHGASSTVIKNHKPDHAIPPLTLTQAGSFTVCYSQAWNSKIVTSAWWVYPHQVSKTAPTGEYLTVGSFMIRGKKNFLPPHPLVMGFGILFRLDESSLSSHLNERRVRGEDEDQQGLEVESLEELSGSDSGDEDGIIENNEHLRHLTLASNGDHFEAKGVTIPRVDGANIAALQPSELLAAANLPKSLSTVVKPKNVHGEICLGGDVRNEVSTSTQLDLLIDEALGVGPAKSSKDLSLGRQKPSVLEDAHDHETKDVAREKPHISKAERRKAKKGVQNSNNVTNGSLVKEDSEEGTSDVRSDNVSENGKQATAKITRGQRGKLKKIKEKYAEQDDEERSIRMALLASSGKALKKENQPQADVEVLVEKSSSGGILDDLKICYKCKKAGHLSRNCPEAAVEGSHLQAVIDEQGNNLGLEALNMQATEKSNTRLDSVESDGDDDVHEAAFDEEKVKSNDLDCLTGNPLEKDNLLYAVPVCGPYNAVQSYKYRVKITPGSAKKGKAVKTAMNLFTRIPEASSREKELMKACTDPELVAAFIGNSKITAPGLTQLKQKQKKGKKPG